MFSLSTIECFLLNKAEKVDKTMTMVGKVSVKHGKGIIQTLCMFNQCRTDHWVLHGLAKQLNANRLDDWHGYVKTINGVEERTLAIYEVAIRKDDGNFVTLHCYGTDEIAHKLQIETLRFKRLLNAYGLQESDVENSSGHMGLMLGLKCQQLQTSCVNKFYSDLFPEVGIYESPGGPCSLSAHA